jgi:hypothetical protein
VDYEKAQEDAIRERAEAKSAYGIALRERQEADEAVRKAEKERLEAEAAEEDARRERAEADAAMAVAAKERAEYEEAKREMEREKAEYEEAQRVAEKERREAIEARKRMEERKALFQIAECILSSHAARDVANRAIQIVPDDHASLEEAVEQARSEWKEGATGGARILIRRGRHPVCHDDEDGGELEIGSEGMPLEIMGQEGACLHGTVLFGRGGGTMEGVRIESGDGPALWVSAGKWSVSKCVLVAHRSYSTALLCSSSGVIELASCRVGGGGPLEASMDGGGVARHAVAVQGRAKATLRYCQLQVCRL